MTLVGPGGRNPSDGARAVLTRPRGTPRKIRARCSREEQPGRRTKHHTFYRILPLDGPDTPLRAKSRPGRDRQHTWFRRSKKQFK